MKKKYCLILLSAVLLTGCSTSEKVEKGIDAEIEIIPYDELQYNGESFTLEDICIYQETASSGYGYYPTVVVTFDISSLSDENLFWMNKNHDIDVSCYLDEGKNKIDFEQMSTLKSYYTDTKLVYMFTEYEQYKYDFSDTDISVFVDLTQEEEYEYTRKDGTTGKLNKVNAYRCYVNTSFSEIKRNVNDISELTDEQKAMQQEGFQEEYKYQLDMYNMIKE